MQLSAPFFFLFSGMAIAFSLLVILKKNPVTSAFCLVMVFFSFAGIYALLGAHLIAALQILVYAGAIMVLFVFVIMLLNADAPSLDIARSSRVFRSCAGVACVFLLGLMIWSFKQSALSESKHVFTPEVIQAAGGNTQVISQLMFSEYILPFELTSILLLAAIVGAVAISKRKLNDSRAGDYGAYRIVSGEGKP